MPKTMSLRFSSKRRGTIKQICDLEIIGWQFQGKHNKMEQFIFSGVYLIETGRLVCRSARGERQSLLYERTVSSQIVYRKFDT